MINSLQTNFFHNGYSNTNNYKTSFGRSIKSNQVGLIKPEAAHKPNLPLNKALLFTMAILAAQNISLTNIPYNHPSAAIEERTEIDFDADDTDIYISDNFTIDTAKTMEEKEINTIAHRGYSAVAPENTIPAFIAAAENGFDGVECDIAWTKDSIPVLLHDETINRTARTENGWKFIFPKNCSDFTYKELLKYDFGSWKSPEFEDTKIPTLFDFLKCCGDYNLKPYIELKETSNFDAAKAEMLVNAVKESGLEDSVTWISFNADYLKLISEKMPNCRLGYLTSEFSADKTISALQTLKTDDNEVFLNIKAIAMDVMSSKLLANAGFYFEAWTVDSDKELDQLFSNNCKAITTNQITGYDVEEHFANEK